MTSAKKIYITAYTCLKQRPIDASLLAEQERCHASAGESFEYSALSIEGNHTRFTLAKDANGVQKTLNGKNTWYVFNGHSTRSRGWIKPEAIRVNSIGTETIKRFEGCFLKQYVCDGGVSTIGYGTTRFPDGAGIPIGAIITQEYAEELLDIDLKRFVAQIRSLVKSPITGKQSAALLSFTYNLGPGALESSMLLKRINNGEDDAAIAREFLKWDKAGGESLPGLRRRRKVEHDLWLGLEPNYEDYA